MAGHRTCPETPPAAASFFPPPPGSDTGANVRLGPVAAYPSYTEGSMNSQVQDSSHDRGDCLPRSSATTTMLSQPSKHMWFSLLIRSNRKTVAATMLTSTRVQALTMKDAIVGPSPTCVEARVQPATPAMASEAVFTSSISPPLHTVSPRRHH